MAAYAELIQREEYAKNRALYNVFAAASNASSKHSQDYIKKLDENS